MSLQKSVEDLQAKLGGVCGLGAVLKFDCGADGVVAVDGKTDPPRVAVGPCDAADVTITLSQAMFCDIVAGKVNPGVAFVMGKIKVKGDKGPLLKLQKVL